MNILETLQLLAALRQAGATHFKSPELEVSLGGDVSKVSIGTKSVPIDPSPTQVTEPMLTAEQEAKIKEANEKITEMIKTMNMSPDELANKMFPPEAE